MHASLEIGVLLRLTSEVDTIFKPFNVSTVINKRTESKRIPVMLKSNELLVLQIRCDFIKDKMLKSVAR